MENERPTDPRTIAKAKMRRLEIDILAVPPAERAASCDGMKRNWEMERRKLESLGFAYPAVSWGDGTFSYDYVPTGAAQ